MHRQKEKRAQRETTQIRNNEANFWFFYNFPEKSAKICAFAIHVGSSRRQRLEEYKQHIRQHAAQAQER